MNSTLRTILVLLGVVCFTLAACSAGGWLDGNATVYALAGFALWLASTLP